MIYLRKEVIDALYNAGIESGDWSSFVNETLKEKLEEMAKEGGDVLK